MTITIRERKPQKGIRKLYLDIYDPGANKTRTSKTLDLFVYDNPTKTQKKSNVEAREAAERIRAKMMIDLAYEKNDLSGLSKKDKSEVDFIEYFRSQTDRRYESMNNYGNWDSVHKHLVAYCPTGVSINQVDPKWLEDFKYYLKHKARTKSNQPLSQNTLHSYFNKVKACLRTAHREELILRNPTERVQGFKQGETKREFLTFEELKRVAKEKCEIPQLKTAFMFSAYTGMRWSDINKLTWSEVEYSEQDDHWRIKFRQKKTHGVETLPIPKIARKLLGEKGKPDDRVFMGLKYSAWHNLRLQQWIMRAGITKNITFHCARHTYATLQLTYGTDIYTVSKMLGHRELKTTQVYAQIIDQKKVEATNAIPNIEM
jgi:integrase